MASENSDGSSNKPGPAVGGASEQTSNDDHRNVLLRSVTRQDGNSLDVDINSPLSESAKLTPCGKTLGDKKQSQHALESDKSAAGPVPRVEDWWRFWVIVWMGTTLAGSFFGGGVGFIAFAASGSIDGLLIPFLGIFVGAMWAGLVGLPVIATFAFIVWCCWLQKNPGILAILAGALTGFVSAPFAFFITSPLGAAGAYWAVTRLCRRLRNDSEGRQPLRPVFSIQDLFWRMTGFAVILTMWLSLIRWFWPLF